LVSFYQFGCAPASYLGFFLAVWVCTSKLSWFLSCSLGVTSKLSWFLSCSLGVRQQAILVSFLQPGCAPASYLGFFLAVWVRTPKLSSLLSCSLGVHQQAKWFLSCSLGAHQPAILVSFLQFGCAPASYLGFFLAAWVCTSKLSWFLSCSFGVHQLSE
jgi:hypothetical protein